MINGKYAIGFVGFGGMAQWHFENFKHFENLSLYCAHDIKPTRNQYAEKKGLKAYPTLEELLSDEKVDIVLVATPNDVHKDIVVKALNAGKHVLCEKPVALSSTELAEMQTAADKNGKIFTVHQNRRFDDDFCTVREIIRSGKLGDIFNIESRVHGSRGIPGDWRGMEKHGGGMVLDWGVHILDQMLLLFDSKIKQVFAQLTNVTNGEVDDGFKVFLTFENGVIALLEVGTSNFINLPRWYLQGANGTAVLPGFASEGKIVTVKNWEEKDVIPVKTAAGLTKTMAPRGDDSVEEIEVPKVTPDIKDFFRNFIAAIEDREALIVKPAEAMRVMKLMETIFESSKTGTVIEFE